MYRNGKWKRRSSSILTVAMESQTGMEVRALVSFTRFGREEGLAYQSPPPSYFNCAMVKLQLSAAKDPWKPVVKRRKKTERMFLIPVKIDIVLRAVADLFLKLKKVC